MKKVSVLVSALLLTVGSANAAIVTVFDGITDGVADFDSTVTDAGGTVAVDVWTGLVGGTPSIDRGDYTITNNDGGTVFTSTYGSMSGQVIGINPATTGDDFFGRGFRDDPEEYFDSGITLTFDDPINSIGFEVGDWATCCQNPVTELFISFDGGAPILVASATTFADGLFPSQNNPAANVYEIFVAAFDDSGEFTEVSFWGNGIGEVLVAGGQVRYALLDQGSLPGTPVPAPGGLALLGLGLAGLGMARRRREVA